VRGGIAGDLVEAVRSQLAKDYATEEETNRLVQATTKWRLRGLESAVADTPRVSEQIRQAYQAMVEEAPLPTLNVRMFGPLEVIADGRAVRFPRKASRALLEMLLVEHPKPVHEERLMDALWPESDPKSSKRSLQTSVNDLRRALDPFHRPNGPSYVLYADETYRLVLPAGCTVDYHSFMKGVPVRIKDPHSEINSASAQPDIATLLNLYRGELLADSPYADYVIEPRERARTLYLDGTVAWVTAIAATDPAEAILLLERGLQTDPFWAEGLMLLMDCLKREGRTLAALRRYRSFEKRMTEELGSEPDAQLRQTYESLTGLQSSS